MAHKRKDTFVKSPEWWRHLRPENKRRVSHNERRAAKQRIKEDSEDETDRGKVHE
jgi:hypothetical protein